MSEHRNLLAAYPRLHDALGQLALTTLPTPVRIAQLTDTTAVIVKDDSRTASLYGGNKVRKLEFLLARALQRRCDTVATFGAVGSHHALATALYAQPLKLHTIAFLSHQTRTGGIAETLALHQALGTTLVPFGGSYRDRIATLRKHLRNRRAMIIPAGGSSWHGNLAYIDAALEFAGQLARNECPRPDRVYVATGTMGTAIGLALGFALCGLHIDVHAVRITPLEITDEEKLRRLASKTACMLHRLDDSFPEDLARRIRLTLRHEFFGAGYAHSNAATERAIGIAQAALGLQLEATYTGKAMAALLADQDAAGRRAVAPMFWQTYHAAPLPATSALPGIRSALPEDFRRYLS